MDTITIGSRVIRKSLLAPKARGRRLIGTVERIYDGRKAYVRWQGALNLIGGRADNHSVLALTSLALATSDTLTHLQAVQDADRAAYEARRRENQRSYVEQFNHLAVGAEWLLICAHNEGRRVQSYHTYLGQDTAGGMQFRCNTCGRVQLQNTAPNIEGVHA